MRKQQPKADLSEAGFAWADFPDYYNDEEALAFIISFAQVDLVALHRGDWLKLQDDLRRFLGIHPGEAQALQDYGLTHESLVALQEELADLLRAFIHARQRYIDGENQVEPVPVLSAANAPKPTQSAALSPDAAIAVEWGPLGVRPRLRSRHLRDQVLFTLSLLLLRNDVDYLRECPTCSRLFYASHGRQKFCSAQCKNRAAWEDFVARQQQGQTLEKPKKGRKQGVRAKVGQARR